MRRSRPGPSRETVAAHRSACSFDRCMNATSVIVGKLIVLGANTRQAATQSQIIKVERQLGCSFPAGVKDFYQACDGVDHATADWIWDFFSLERVVEGLDDDEVVGDQKY